MNSDAAIRAAVWGVFLGLGWLWILGLVWAQRCVRRELQRRGWRSLVVGWRAFALRPAWGPTFRVLYADAEGVVHQADCSVRHWHQPVIFGKHTILGDPPPLPEWTGPSPSNVAESARAIPRLPAATARSAATPPAGNLAECKPGERPPPVACSAS